MAKLLHIQSAMDQQLATEHTAMFQTVATEQVTLTFCNIDWKWSRDYREKAAARNLGLRADTVASITTKQSPSVICFCEVGEAGKGMAPSELEAMLGAIQSAWATDTMSHQYFAGEAYLTMWLGSRVRCFDF